MPKKRGRKKKFKTSFNMRTEAYRSVFAIILIVIGGIIILSYLSVVFGNSSQVQIILRRIFGLANILLAPLLIIAGLILMNMQKWKFVETRVLVGLSMLLFGASGLLHSFKNSDDAYKIAIDGGGGGMIGYHLSSLLAGIVSVYGAALIFVALLIVGIVFITDKPFEEIMHSFSKFIPNMKLKRKTGDKTTDEKETSEQIEISSDLDLSFNPSNETSTKEVTTQEKPVEPAFEIIPNVSEPKHAQIPSNAAPQSEINGLSPALPYADKVWQTPPLDILLDPPTTPIDRGDVNQRGRIIEQTLESFGIKATVKDIRFGPSVTQYSLESEAGTKIAKIANLQYDLALALASPTGSVRIEAPIPGKSLVGIEVPNNNRVVVNFKSVLTSDQMKNNKLKLPIALGSDVGGTTRVYDITKMPHMLIAGATGSGKSIFIHNIMFSILFKASPQEVKFILIDPKRVELVHYNGIPHLLTPVVTDNEKAPSVFNWAVKEMDRRLNLLETAGVRDINAYNEKSGFQAMPYIVLIVDELAEIMIADPATVEKSIIRIAQLARATGIHLVLAMQRPSTNIITGLIKANIPCRVAFNVTNNVDSRVIIDQPGAEKLLGKGDMLFVPPDVSKPTRIQGAFIDDKEISKLVSFLKSSGIEPENKEEEIFATKTEGRSISAGGDDTDEYFDEALDIVVNEGKASASLLQRRLSIGYSRAARILDELEAKGVVGPPKGSKPREVLITNSNIQDDMPIERQEFY